VIFTTSSCSRLLYQSLIEEFSTVSSEKILSEQELESGLEECTTSSRRLDSTSKEASDAILKYSLYLNEIRIVSRRTNEIVFTDVAFRPETNNT
jgi:hypothetical protein